MNYNHESIEKKWRKIWDETPINKPDSSKEKFYCLDMFPYPSASGLHVGHWRGYVLSDVLSRHKILQGFEVLHPMGWDAFGLPAENYAIKVGQHPSKITVENIKLIKEQLKEISAVYDWNKEINTTDTKFYKWTQWIFIQMYKKGLAYEKEMPLNWCPSCKCVLANEEATSGECERCGSTVTKKMLRQWMLKITEYSERLLSDLDNLDWPEKVKKMQSDWIGKSYGAQISFNIVGMDKKIDIFTTRPDTLYGATFIVLAPESELVKELIMSNKNEEMEKYIFSASTKSSVDRVAAKEKTGVFTGNYAINPINNEEIEIWISDYVLADYGTGAIMCVPAHDTRDFEFAQKFKLPIRQVICNKNEIETKLDEAYTESGIIINSGEFNGLDSTDAKDIFMNHIEEKNIGERKTNFKLRDWVFSRQRYWGEPIPIIHCDDCGIVTVPESQLPVLLPNIESYEPTNTGESPLAQIEEFVNTSCPNCNKSAKRETNTMPQWAGSSWYYLRYMDVNNDNELASLEKIKEWAPVDYYVGGIEHAVLHLLYSRFYTKFLYDIGVVNFEEPFKKLFNQGMISKNGSKMSKSKGNVVSPDELVSKYGCDSLRMYELFIGPPELDCEWDDSGIEGVYRYLGRLWRLVEQNKDKIIRDNKKFEFARNKLIYEITNKIENLTLNTAISSFMEFTNKLTIMAKEENGIDRETINTLLILISPFAPHIAEEMWQLMGNKNSIFKEKWPTYDIEKMKEDTVEIAIQVNGKFKQSVTISRDSEEAVVISEVKKALGDKLDGINIVKEIYVPNRIVNIVGSSKVI
jgi:leucyl-tRNA synthetase